MPSPSSPAKRIAVLKANIKRYNNRYTPPPGGGLWRTANMKQMRQYNAWRRELKNLAARSIQKHARAAATRRRSAAIGTASRSNLPRLPGNLWKIITSVGRR